MNLILITYKLLAEWTLDSQLDPDSLTEVAIDKKHKKIYLKEHIYRNGLKSQELAEIVLDKVDNMLIIADSSEPRLIADLKHLGVNIKPVKKGTIESGITRMQDYTFSCKS